MVYREQVKRLWPKSLPSEATNAIDADEAFGYFGDPKTGEPRDEQIQMNWIWDLARVKALAESSVGKAIFVCGGAINQDKVQNCFDKRFTLAVDDNTLKRRLQSRTNNDFGKHPDDLARQLEWNKGTTEYAKRIGSTVIDATRPIGEVADEVLKLAGP